MNVTTKIFLVVICIISSTMSKAQVTDTVLYQKDSAIELDPDRTTEFFQNGERVTNPLKVLLITKTRKTTSLSALLKTKEMVYSDHTLSDLDNDGKKELLISNFTGGAHCCDEIYIYKNISPNKYQYVVRMFGGHTVITEQKEFQFSFNEQLGYFFTCYACGYDDTSDEAIVPLRSIVLKYTKGKIAVIPGSKVLRSTINDNLRKLGNQPFERLDDDMAMDNGLRKEFAMNLVVFYYSFGRNLAETQKLFNKYYRYPDAAKVWTAFTKSLLYIKKDNDF